MSVPTAEPAPNNSGNLPLILVVDDSPLNLKFLFAALRRTDFKVMVAENGTLGLELAEQHHPDLILLDVMMPGIDGFETCCRLKQNPQTREIPVIFMTALSDTIDKVNGFEVGAADYLTKPVDIPEVIARVRTQLKVANLQKDLRRQNERLAEENEKRRRVQDALRESRGRYRLLAENSTDIISRQTLSGVYQYVSPACHTLLGYDIEEMISKPVLDFVHPDDRKMVEKSTHPGQNCPSTVTFTYRAVCKSGGFIWLETVSKTVCDDKGRPVEIVSVSRDVTDRVELAQKLREHNKELDAFAHTVAHDLKNPVSTVISYTDFLIGAWDKLDEAKIKDFIGNIRSVGQKGLYIIDELMLLATVRKGEVKLHSLDMAAIVTQVLERLELMIQDFDAQITVPESWPTAAGYAPWIEEAWINYLSNAIKYGGRPPRIELGATPQDDGMVRFWVRDNGKGLTAEEQSRLFAEFIRLDEVRVEGHGLGLSIVRRIVDKLGGQVGVESQPGHGSTFWFTLPSAKETA